VNFLSTFTDESSAWKISSASLNKENTNKEGIVSRFTIFPTRLDGQANNLELHREKSRSRNIDLPGLKDGFSKTLVPFLKGIREARGYLAPNVGWGTGNIFTRYLRLLIDMTNICSEVGMCAERLELAAIQDLSSNKKRALIIRVRDKYTLEIESCIGEAENYAHLL